MNEIGSWAMQVKNAELLLRSKVGRRSGWVALVMVLALFSGCVTSAKVTQQPATTVTNQGPSVARLEDGRQGFVIREKPNMDAKSRGDFERAVAMMNDGKNDTAIELLAKVIERSPGVDAYINIAVAYMRTKNLTARGAAPQNSSGTGSIAVANNEYGLLLRKSV
jgi:hypothetical protein